MSYKIISFKTYGVISDGEKIILFRVFRSSGLFHWFLLSGSVKFFDFSSFSRKRLL